MSEMKKMLRLTVEVPDLHADDLDESAALYAMGEEGSAANRLDVVLEEWMRSDVVLTICTLPGEKSMNDDFEMVPLRARIVAAETVDR